jgi:tyrosyl-tRNA synthetase
MNMSKTIIDREKIKELLSRGVENIYPNKEALEKELLSGKKLKLYCGFDPSASALHIGNAIAINKLSQFQALGHEVIFLIGDFTGMIGDPSDKTAVRKKLMRAEVLENAQGYQRQAAAYLDFAGDNPAKILYNSEWSDQLTFKDLIEITSNFTVQQMIQRDMFQKRLEEDRPIYLHEFLYPVAQGYDSVAMDVDLEVGGNDQMFNMLAGRDLQRIINKKEKFVLTTSLLADDRGKKMGKSEGNAIFLNTEPKNMYGVIMSWPDEIISKAFELCTKVPMAEIAKINQDLQDAHINPRDIKMRLALEITRMVYGEEIAASAREYFIKTVQKKEAPDEVKIYHAGYSTRNIVDLLAETGMAGSKSEAKRLLTEGAIKVDGNIIKTVDYEIEITPNGILLQRGKRMFLKVVNG